MAQQRNAFGSICGDSIEPTSCYTRSLFKFAQYNCLSHFRFLFVLISSSEFDSLAVYYSHSNCNLAAGKKIIITDFLLVYFDTMDLKRLFTQRVQKIDMLNDFITLYCAKEESIQDLQQLTHDTQEIKEMLSEAVDILQEFTLKNRQAYKSLMDQMQRQQLILLDLLEKQMDMTPIQTQAPAHPFAKPQATAAAANDDSGVNESVLKEISNTNMTPNRFRLNEPARMTLVDYSKSPFTNKRIKPVALHFYDFERNITADEFVSVPS